MFYWMPLWRDETRGKSKSGAKEDLVSIKFVQPEFILWWIKHDRTVHQLIQQIFTKLHLNYELQCADKFEPLQLLQGSSIYEQSVDQCLTLNFSPGQMKAEYHELSFAAPAPAEMRNFFSSSRKASMPYPWSDSSQHWWNSTAVQYHTKRWEKSGLPVLHVTFPRVLDSKKWDASNVFIISSSFPTRFSTCLCQGDVELIGPWQDSKTN